MATKIQELEDLRTKIAHHEATGLHERARELSAQLPTAESAADAERRAIRARVSPIAALGDAVFDPAAPQSPAHRVVDQGHNGAPPERRAYRAGLSDLLAKADALRERQIRERGR